jgi:hypothetical protein
MMQHALSDRVDWDRTKKPPFVRATTATNGAEGFTINQEMYVWFERDPNETRPGYVGREVLAVVDEQTVRRDLETFFAVSPVENRRQGQAEPPIVITGLALVPAWLPSSAAVCTPRAGERKN